MHIFFQVRRDHPALCISPSQLPNQPFIHVRLYPDPLQKCFGVSILYSNASRLVVNLEYGWNLMLRRD